MNLSALTSPKISNPVKVLFKTVSKEDDRLFFEPLKLESKNLGDIFASINKNNSVYNGLEISLENKDGANLGKEIFTLDCDTKKMFGFDINIKQQFRGSKLGELLRLLSVMIMKENKSPGISNYSKENAVYFHSKFKFLPNIWRFSDRDNALKTMVNDNSKGFFDLQQKADKIQARVLLDKDNSEMKRQLCRNTNELVIEYIERAMQENKPDLTHPFEGGMDMTLTQENLLKNREFFNKKFQDAGIDYKI